MPTEQLKSVGLWGIGAVILMGISSQIPTFPVDWTIEFMQVPLGAAVVLFASGVGGWLKGGGAKPKKK